jgi:hypothetical protein
MDEIDIRDSAKFLVARHGIEEAKVRAAQRTLGTADAKGRAAWLSVLQAIINLGPYRGSELR